MVPLMSVPLCTVSSLYLIREADIIGCIDVYSDKADPPRPIKMCTPNFPTEMAIFYANPFHSSTVKRADCQNYAKSAQTMS